MKPILVTGIIRSGTTWVGRVLASCDDTIYIHEPFNPDSAWNACFPLPMPLMYLTEESGKPYAPLFQRLLDLDPRFRGQWRIPVKEDRLEYIDTQRAKHSSTDPTLILKDPMALFSVDWLVDNFSVVPVFVLRHPISIIKSIIRIGWGRKITLNSMTYQPLLAQHLLGAASEDYQRILGPAATGRSNRFPDNVILFVRYAYLAILAYRKAHPDWEWISYEDYGATPEKFLALIERLRLIPSDETRESLRSSHREQYDPGIVLYNSIVPLESRTEEIFSPTAEIEDWLSVFQTYFSDIHERLADLVCWEPQ